MQKLKEKSIPLPITFVARTVAEMFASEQPTQSKKRQVYLNTLAVLVVNNYMEMRKTPTELKKSDSWHPSTRLCANVSDLKIAKLGHLECRPINPVPLTQLVTELCNLPEEMPDDRIGCIVVEIDEDRREANLLGFAKTVSSGKVFISELFQMDAFGKYLKELSIKAVEQPKELVKLSQWFQNTFEASWQTMETLFGTTNLSFNARGIDVLNEMNPFNSALSISRARQIDLGMRLASLQLALIVTIAPKIDKEIYVRLRLRPLREQICLPAGVKMTVFDQSGSTCPDLEVHSRDADKWIQLQFEGDPEEKFSVLIAFESSNIIEYFVI